MVSIWLPIKNGPLLIGAKCLLDAFQADPALRGRYRVGDERRKDGKREIEIICDTEATADKAKDVAMIAKLSCP
ncbi:hypothetical protein [Rhizobium sp. ZPR3]|uniref:Uncharacterized protein n=2 Tax=unclassified Rhizobium TaxID=2613769 RepID=A0AAU7SFE9_9HYPH